MRPGQPPCPQGFGSELVSLHQDALGKGKLGCPHLLFTGLERSTRWSIRPYLAGLVGSTLIKKLVSSVGQASRGRARLDTQRL